MDSATARELQLACTVGATAYTVVFVAAFLLSWALFTLAPRARPTEAGGPPPPPWTPMLSQMTAQGGSYAAWLVGAAACGALLVVMAAASFFLRRAAPGFSQAPENALALACACAAALGLFLLAFFSAAWADALHLAFSGVFIGFLLVELYVSSGLAYDLGAVSRSVLIFRYALGACCYLLAVASFLLAFRARRLARKDGREDEDRGAGVRAAMRGAALAQYAALLGHLAYVASRAHECATWPGGLR